MDNSLDTLTDITTDRLDTLADNIRDSLGRIGSDVVKTGRWLLEAKDLLRHGEFGDWLEREFNMTHRMADNFMNVARTFQDSRFETLANFTVTALYLLAAPSVPDALVEQAEQLAAEGHTVTPATVRQLRGDTPDSHPPDPTPDEKYRWQVENHKQLYSPVVQWMRQGMLTPKRALALCYALDGCKPKVRGHMLLHRVWDSALIAAMNTSEKSDGYAEAVTEGGVYMPDGDWIPLDMLTVSDWKMYMAYRQRERMLQKYDVDRPPPISILVYPGDMARTLRELHRVLSSEDLSGLQRLIGEKQLIGEM